MKVTRTFGPIHFDDLTPTRFEDLCLAMVYRLEKWVDIKHPGRKGKDGGVDIYARQELENGKIKDWYIQCKRYQKISNSELKKITDEIIKKNKKLPDVLLLIISCDLSKDNDKFFIKYAKEKGIPEIKIWASSILETKLYSEYHDLLFAYFNIPLSQDKRERIATVRRNIKLKKQMRNDFQQKTFDHRECLRHPNKAMIHRRVLIRSIDDKFYPDNNPNKTKNGSFFDAFPYDFYHNGLELYLYVVEILLDKDGSWDIKNYNETPRKGQYACKKAYQIGRLPFENIIVYDIDGDEYYDIPHIFCDFSCNGEPYEEIVYSLIGHDNTDQDFDSRLKNEDRKILP
jgi:hypothetical protein